ncbi:phasin family protein [Methylocapsa acidiphila]|uniref:phasin family protein n=1 Tax=Methylocapsa acidiphila TaxID=133552 RepID=UPI000429A29B|nr:phasin family protein [Methylocapsa acidiphila]
MAQQDPQANPAASGIDAAVGGMADASKRLQAFAGEIAQMSKETFDHASATVEKLRGAHNLEDILAIQTSFVKEAFEHAAQHTRKFSELFSAFPLELTKTYQDAWAKSVDAAMKSTEAARKAVASNVERFSEAIHKEAGPGRDS